MTHENETDRRSNVGAVAAFTGQTVEEVEAANQNVSLTEIMLSRKNRLDLKP